MNAVARTQLTFQMLTLLKKYHYHVIQCYYELNVYGGWIYKGGLIVQMYFRH